ncbi:hypothetical protein R3P38DRAFT_2857620 [Favolaschia claudopus]|uniref:Uncharacterized protein n=1 Tax=Favolaschia claudopus TaxID=2862362 RepID=A0AAW0DKN9_9AGAR
MRSDLSSSQTQTVFPPELEQMIFEIAAYSWRPMIPTLLLIAWRVKIWLEPLLYRTLIVADDRTDDSRLSLNTIGQNIPTAVEPEHLLSLIRTKPSGFFRDSVRNLFLAHAVRDEELTIVSACSGIENLWLGHTTICAINDLKTHRLKRLHCTFEALFGETGADFTQPLFAVSTWIELTRLPNLTHLAFGDQNYLEMVASFLPHWESLRAVLFLSRASSLDDTDPFNAYGDWVHGVHLGCDFWSRADEFIARRKAGEVDRLDYWVPGINYGETVDVALSDVEV